MSDILHDVLEGALQYETKLMLREFICHDRYFSLEQLNQIIESYDFGYLETKNRPTPVALCSLTTDSDYSLKQSGIQIIIKVFKYCSFCSAMYMYIASQMWCFGRFLPVMIGDWVPSGNELWTLYMMMLDIVDILFSPELQSEDIATLSILIENHHREFIIVYPNASFIPKMHFISTCHDLFVCKLCF